MKIFHYLLSTTPGGGSAECSRINAREVEVSLAIHPRLGGSAQEKMTTRIPFDQRDQRVLIVIDGELLWESLPKGGDVIESLYLGTLSTFTDHLRKPRFGNPSYWIPSDGRANTAFLAVRRHFLLLPSENFVFRYTRDLLSFTPAYVMGEVRRGRDDGRGSVVWHKTTY